MAEDPVFLNHYKLGNDIVNISVPSINDKQFDERFIQRVFTANEQSAIFSSHSPATLLWTIWSAKEAAFKAYQKIIPDLIFSHKKFFIADQTLKKLQNNLGLCDLTGILLYEHEKISLYWQWQPDIVHCIAVWDHNLFSSWDKLYWQVDNIATIDEYFALDSLKKYFTARELETIYSNESLLTRFFAKQCVKRTGFQNNIEIIRQPLQNVKKLGPPLLVNHEKKWMPYEISLSHDEGWSAVVIGK